MLMKKNGGTKTHMKQWRTRKCNAYRRESEEMFKEDEKGGSEGVPRE